MSSSAPSAKQAVTVRHAAMDFLARREHSFHELLQKLIKKFPDLDRDEVMLPVLGKLRDENLQSDSRYAEALVNSRSKRGFGPLKIAAELQPRQLDRALIKTALFESGPDWELLCRDLLQRKFKPAAKPALEERQRWQRFLQQRGFEQEQIRAAIKAVLQDSTDHNEYE